VKYPYGPVPKNHDLTLAHLQHMNVIEVDEYTNDDGWTMILIKACEPFDSTLFTPDELATMKEVEAYFREYSSRKISDYAHNELGWLETQEKQPISYKYADQLRDFYKFLINEETQVAIHDVNNNRKMSKTFDTVNALMEDLND
jgi:hypothetical protein